ncbi:MAG: phosphatase PAP2 family protein [Thermoleophilia bacterium]
MQYLVLLVVVVLAAVSGATLVHRFPVLLAPGVMGRRLEWVRTLLRRARGRQPEPATAAGVFLAAAAVVAVAGGVVVTLLWLAIRDVAAVRHLDAGVARWGRAHATAASDTVMRRITDLGDTRDVLILGLLVAVVELLRRPNPWVLGYLAVAPAGASAVCTAIKDLTHRVRPTVSAEAAHLGPSFPSGHSATAAAFYGAVALVLARGTGTGERGAWAAAACAIAAGVACTRVLLGVHWTSDVLAGLALGWAWWAVCTMAGGHRLLRVTLRRRRRLLEPGAHP